MGNTCRKKKKEKNRFLLTRQSLGSVAQPRSVVQQGNLYGRVQLVKLNLVVLVSFLYDVPMRSVGLTLRDFSRRDRST